MTLGELHPGAVAFVKIAETAWVSAGLYRVEVAAQCQIEYRGRTDRFTRVINRHWDGHLDLPIDTEVDSVEVYA